MKTLALLLIITAALALGACGQNVDFAADGSAPAPSPTETSPRWAIVPSYCAQITCYGADEVSVTTSDSVTTTVCLWHHVTYLGTSNRLVVAEFQKHSNYACYEEWVVFSLADQGY